MGREDRALNQRMNPSKNYHAILGENPGPITKISSGPYELAFQYHPDRNPHNPKAEEKFKQVAEAYAFLSGNHELLRAVQAPSATARKVEENFSDIFDEIFGIDFDRWTPPGKDLYEMVEISLEEAYRGLTRKLGLWQEHLCRDCGGKGSVSGPSRTCSYCFGRGNIQVTEHGVSFDKQCPKCRGLGRIPKDPCRKCRGMGVIPKKETVIVAIPPKVHQGQEIRYPGQGSMAAPGSGRLGHLRFPFILMSSLHLTEPMFYAKFPSIF
jgi:molecular chaperone DnaJ